LVSCSVVIPAYKSQASLHELVERLIRVLPSITHDYEIILVNDGSPDQTWATITDLAQQFQVVRGINLMRNYGQHNATLCGIFQAKYELIITMDDDLQHPPEEIYKLIEELEKGYDVVYGIPIQPTQSWWRRLTSWLIKRILSYVMGIKTLRNISSFRIFKTNLRKAFIGFNKPEVVVDVLFSWGTHNFGSVYVDETSRLHGKSNYNFRKLVSYAMTVLTGFSTAPLRFTSLIGFIFMLGGIVAFIYVLVIHFTAGSILGFSFLASIISLFSGAILFALGIFGEYQARIFERTSERPCFTINNTTDGAGE
jgi:undecaprenyl-phosphate 4-deoxy-4-formamido-L-arabinose transferase